MTNDKRRTDACLKACEGISTQNLEDNVPFLELARLYNAVLRERDALRAEVNVWRRQAEAYWAKIEQMEKQESVVQPAPSVPSGLHPLETVRFWADAYTHPGDDNFRGHAMAAALLREYAELRAALEAEAKP